jgi:hypothetical protein
MLLYWTLIRHAIAERRLIFDFGRSSPDAGTYRFKEQWGARAEALCWEYQLLNSGRIPVQGPDNARAAKAIAVWKMLPLTLTNAVGPWVVRAIP